VERLLSLRQLQSNKAIRAHPRSRKPLTLLLALVLCLFVFVLSSNEAWAKGQPSSTEQQQPTAKRTTIVNGKQVADPEPVPQPTLLQRMVAITTTGDETAAPRAEPTSASQEIDFTPTTTTTTTPSTTPFELAPVSVSATPTVDRGSPEIESSTAAEEGSAALPANLLAPSEVWEPVIPSPALQQQVAQVVASQEQSRPSYYSTSGIAPSSAAVQPLTWTLNNVIGTNTSATVSTVAGVLGTVGNWLSEAPSSAEDSSSSSQSTWPAPSAPVSPEQQLLGSSYIGLSSGMGQASSAGGLGTTLLLGVLFVASIELLRRDFRTYLVSIELPKPSSALLSPLERPG
jgi:hypothetical protein